MSRDSFPNTLANEDATLAERVVTLSAVTQTLTKEAHANRLLVINAVAATDLKTITLPKASGSGDKYEILNNAIQTQSIVIAALGADVLSGTAFVLSETTTNTDVFHTSATSDKYTFNITTTGGLRGDRTELVDFAAGTWLVKILGNGSGTLATGFAAT
jgi:hypothetical protein